MQAIPQITALNPLATAIPLLFVLSATAVKDAYDDIVSTACFYLHNNNTT